MSRTVSDVMTAEPVAVWPETRFKTCAKVLQLHKLTALPVIDDAGGLVGIVSEADLLAKEANGSAGGRNGKARATSVGEMMTGGPVTTTADTPLNTAASLMFEHYLKMLPVVDSAMKLVGSVTRSQVLNVFLRSDEAIRRDVARELRLVPEIIRGAVDVEVREGVVHLSGVLGNESTTELLTTMVSGIPGVVGVVMDRIPSGKLVSAATVVSSDGRA